MLFSTDYRFQYIYTTHNLRDTLSVCPSLFRVVYALHVWRPAQHMASMVRLCAVLDTMAGHISLNVRARACACDVSLSVYLFMFGLL